MQLKNAAIKFGPSGWMDVGQIEFAPSGQILVWLSAAPACRCAIEPVPARFLFAAWLDRAIERMLDDSDCNRLTRGHP